MMKMQAGIERGNMKLLGSRIILGDYLRTNWA